jgi:hypothetical protein
MRSLCRARHETINGRLKSFRILSTKFRDNLNKHQSCFQAILSNTQIHIVVYDSNFQVYYNEDIDLFDSGIGRLDYSSYVLTMSPAISPGKNSMLYGLPDRSLALSLSPEYIFVFLKER